MPYFIYKCFPNRHIEPVTQYQNYAEAKAYVKQQRPLITKADNFQLRIIFAAHTAEAERLLKTPREPQPLREDDI